MTLVTPEHAYHGVSSWTPGIEYYSDTVDQFPDRNDQYIHSHFTEANDSERTRAAWRIHALGYLSMGFVNQDAITPDGYLASELDKSRGSNTDYYSATTIEELTAEDDAAVIRLYNLEPGKTFRDLPSYAPCEKGLSEEGVQLLEAAEAEGRPFKEAAAFARTERSKPLASHEIVRRIIHDAIVRDEGEVWFFGIVTTTHDSLAGRYGEENFKVLGEDVPINDERVNDATMLRPTMLVPEKFADNILNAYQESVAVGDAIGAKRLRRGFMFFVDGLAPEMMSSEVRAAKEDFLAAQVIIDSRRAQV